MNDQIILRPLSVLKNQVSLIKNRINSKVRAQLPAKNYQVESTLSQRPGTSIAD